MNKMVIPGSPVILNPNILRSQVLSDAQVTGGYLCLDFIFFFLSIPGDFSSQYLFAFI